MYLYADYEIAPRRTVGIGQQPVYPDPRPHPAVDRWTLVHALTGFTLGALGVPPALALALALGYEVVEANTNIRPSFFMSTRPEGAANVAVDLLVFSAGLAAGVAVR